MGRYYRLSKPLLEDEAEIILQEMRELENVAKIELSENLDGVIIYTVDGEYGDVMDRAVNVFSRESVRGEKDTGVTLCFDHFVMED